MKTRLSMLATLVLAGCLPPGNECRIDGTGADPADVVRQALTIYGHLEKYSFRKFGA